MARDAFQKTPLHFLQYIALKAVCLFVRALPYRLAVWMGRTIIAPVRWPMHKRFVRMQHDIARAFPDKSPQEVHQIALDSWCNMGAIFAEFLKLSSMSKAQFRKHCRIDGVEKLTSPVAKNGGIIHIGHFTNWEAFGLAASVYGFEKAVLAQRIDNPYVDKEINRLRHVFSGCTLYSNHQDKPFFTCMRWLKKKQMLGILFDQNTTAGEMWIPFLGRMAAFAPITALLAIKMQVPVFPVNVSREKNGQLVCTVYDPILPPLEYSLEHVRDFTQLLVRYYEQWVRQNPASWLWAHNRWKREAEGLAYLQQHPQERV